MAEQIVTIGSDEPKVVLLRGFEDFAAVTAAVNRLNRVFGEGAPVLVAADFDGITYNAVAVARRNYLGPVELLVHPSDLATITRYALGSMANAIANAINLPEPR